MYFILDGENIPLPTEDVVIWARWHSENKNQVSIGDDVVKGLRVSTRFFGTEVLGLVCMWETLVFSGRKPLQQFRRRYEVYREAVEGHQDVMRQCEVYKK